MSKVKAHQFAFLSQAVGGSRQYSGAMREPAIKQRPFDAIAVHFVETLGELGASEETIPAIGAALTTLSAQIVNMPAQAAADRPAELSTRIPTEGA